jgi:predicted transcriptional regulator
MADEKQGPISDGSGNQKHVSSDIIFQQRVQLDLPEIEEEVIEVAKILMEKHYILDTQQLFILAVKLMPEYPHVEISEAITRLLSKKVLFNGKALARDDVFTNITRKRMFELICYRPGIHVSAIRALTGKDSRTVLFHLSVLERFHFVRTLQINNNKAYFEGSTSGEFDVLDYYFQKDGAKEIFKTILENPSISYDELRSMLGDTIPSSALAMKVKLLMLNDLLSGRLRSDRIASLNIPARFRKRIKMLFVMTMQADEFRSNSQHVGVPSVPST